jgi:hypothetical protein
MPGARTSLEQASDQADDDLEAAVEEAIAECGGNMRETIRELVVACRYLDKARHRALNLGPPPDLPPGMVRLRLVK